MELLREWRPRRKKEDRLDASAPLAADLLGPLGRLNLSSLKLALEIGAP